MLYKKPVAQVAAPASQPERSSVQPQPSQQTTQEIRTLLCQFLIDTAKTWSPDAVLEEFKQLFIHPANISSSAHRKAVRELIFANEDAKFKSLLKRSCYILINNWNTAREYQAIQDLILLFEDASIKSQTSSPTLKRLRGWLQEFINSEDYTELKLFAAKYEENAPWKQRYASFLFTSQYADANNPIEQRKAAKVVARHLREQYKFDLALYTARSQRRDVKSQMLNNPTELGDEVLNLVQKVVGNRGFFNHANLANIFIKQTQHLSYGEFKQSLQKYLVFSMKDHGVGETIATQLGTLLAGLYENREDDKLDDALILRTCNRIIETLTADKTGKPSPLFITLLTQGSPLTLVMILLKLILVCKHARTHLETCIAKLIRYYEDYPESECQGVIRFLEIYNVTFTIHAENVRYNLVSMKELVTRPDHSGKANAGTTKANAGTTRIFSQQTNGSQK